MPFSDARNASDYLARRAKAQSAVYKLQMPANVLIVDDNPTDAERTSAVLRMVLGRNVNIRTAATVANALLLLSNFTPGIILIDDYIRPSHSAQKTIATLRRSGYLGPLAVISSDLDGRSLSDLQRTVKIEAIHKDDVNCAALSELIGRSLRA